MCKYLWGLVTLEQWFKIKAQNLKVVADTTETIHTILSNQLADKATSPKYRHAGNLSKTERKTLRQQRFVPQLF